jgi:hypothetical protein
MEKQNWDDCHPGWPEHKAQPYLKSDQCTKGWHNGLRGRDLPSKHEALSSTISPALRKKFVELN